MRTSAAGTVLVAAMLAGCTAPVPVDILVENVTVYSGVDDVPFVATVAVRNGRFAAIDRSRDGRYVAAETIDGSGRFMTPGLWDAHAHIRSSGDRGLDLQRFVEFGVTSIHDLGGNTRRVKAAAEGIASGATPGPSTYPAFFMLNGESFASHQRAVTTEAEIVAAVDELAALGAAQIKVHRALSPDLLPVVVDAARARGLVVTGHIPLGLHPLDACESGMRGVEHIGSFVEAVISVAAQDEQDSRAALDYLLSDAAEPLYECLAGRNVAVTPTLVIYPSIARRRAGSDDIPQEFAELIEAMQRITLRLYESGVMLLTGTDTSDYYDPVRIEPGASLHDELLMFEQAGVPPAAIITAASLNPARAIGVDERSGSIELHKDADFLLLQADPEASLRNLQAIVAVYQAGRRVWSADPAP